MHDCLFDRNTIKLIIFVKVPVVGNTADTPNPSGLLHFKRKFGSSHG